MPEKWLIKVYAQDHQHHEVPNTTQVYPNPAHRQLNIVFADKVEGILKLVNANGQTMQKKKLTGATSAQLDLKYLPSGIYLLSMPLPNGQMETRRSS